MLRRYITGRFRLSHAQNLSVRILLAVTSIPVLSINLILALALVKSKQLINSTNVFILFLSLSDCAQGSVEIPLGAALFILYHNTENCILSCTAQAFHFFTTQFLILLIAFDRYMNVKPEFSEDHGCLGKLKSKSGRIFRIIVCCMMSFTHGACSFIQNKCTNLLITCLTVIDTVAIMINYVLYVRMYIKVRRHYQTSVICSNGSIRTQSDSTRQYVKE